MDSKTVQISFIRTNEMKLNYVEIVLAILLLLYVLFIKSFGKY